ncbi:hypothetical protein BT96DRAFT_994057 [Gymnopus androsaceus JB14]|uniref:Uncharacterized protein n=1 Tax=Gymnopus androsaceus JB14 TaxID=1447944 RepID=A0A6A4HK73_9AGAR|nr:hypothetical protein BT96DRAFT_994057 [Gymnopus androsaceus JB14]
MAVNTSYTLPRIIVVMVECILYGAYAVLFGIAAWILPHKFHVSSVKKLFLPIITVLFILATINITYDLVGEAYAILFTIPAVEKPWIKAGQSIDLITFMLADILGDSVLVRQIFAIA